MKISQRPIEIKVWMVFLVRKFLTLENRPLGKHFKCRQQGHLSNECPQRRTLTLQEEHHGEDTFDSESSIQFEYAEADLEEDQLPCILQT